ncbi:MAG TPA: hypothetical protein VLT59_16910 [Steroidobacteraceae bacterium]|nr:hypothetical protein [Steroidobacteraceae bacterium]
MRSYRGRIAYLHEERGETGRERFEVSVFTTGRTVRAHCEMDLESLLRDVTYTVDASWRPLDAYVRLTVGDCFQGAAWYRFRDDGVECEQWNVRAGRTSQFLPLGRRAKLFAPHPLVTDGWQARAYDFSAGPGRQRVEHCTNSSSTPDGSTGPMVCAVYKDLEYLGRTSVRTAAGTFECRHMKIHPVMGTMAAWPPLEFWIAGEDCLLVRMRWPLLSSTYDLVELEGDAR